MAIQTLVESIAGLRKKLLRNGVIVSIITYAKKGELILSPEIDMNDLHFDGILDSGYSSFFLSILFKNIIKKN